MRYDHLNGAHSYPKITGGAKTVGHPVHSRGGAGVGMGLVDLFRSDVRVVDGLGTGLVGGIGADVGVAVG